MEFGELLRHYREEAGLSQNALARAAGMEPTNMNRLERSNQGPPRKTTIVKLVRALGWSLVDERSQRLMAAAGYGAFPEDDEGEVYASPINVLSRNRRRPLTAVLHELNTTLLRTVELVGEAIEIARETEDEGA